MDGLAPPLAHNPDEERRGSWTGDFEASRRTSFSNSFLETPPRPARNFPPRSFHGPLHHVSLEDEPDLMSTPPISPMLTRSSRPTSSYFDDTSNSAMTRKSREPEEDHDGSLFSALLNRAFETVSKSGEAMDVHARESVIVADRRRAAKGKGRAIAYDEDDEPLPVSPIRTSFPARTMGTHQNRPAPTSYDTRTTPLTEEEYNQQHPFEAGLVNTLEAVEQKVSGWWSWLTDEDGKGRDGQRKTVQETDVSRQR